MIRVRNHAPNHFVFCFFRKRKRNSHCVILGKVVTVIDDCCNRCCFLFFFSLCVIGQYEPVFTAGSQPFVHHMNVYECVGDPSVFEVLAATEGSRCYQPSMPPLFFNCNNVVVAWTAGSEVCNKKTNPVALEAINSLFCVCVCVSRLSAIYFISTKKVVADCSRLQIDKCR
jgi:hypothetical protein